VFVSLRLYVKTCLVKSWEADDFLLILALVSIPHLISEPSTRIYFHSQVLIYIKIFFIVFCASALAAVSLGAGQHLTAITPENVPKALRLCWLCEMFYTITTVFTRLSTAVFLIRLSTQRVHKWTIYITVATFMVFSIFYFFLVLFQCSPVDYFWKVHDGEKGHCINRNIIPAASIANSVISFVADWILGLLPIAILKDLQMNKRTKWSVAGLLSLGLL
jgi:hypothetical protein